MTAFFRRLSTDSRQRRFFSAAEPAIKLIDSFCDDSDPRKQLCLIVMRATRGRTRIIASANYMAHDGATAEIALAVDDAFQGKGIGSLLLERLAVLAVRNGFRRFWAITMPDNQQMLDVFRESGFECRSQANDGCVEIDLSVIPNESSVARAEFRDRVATTASLRPFFQPSCVAIVGASRSPTNIGTRVLNAIVSAGFQGTVYPVNPKADVVRSLKAYPSIRALPKVPDLVVVAVPANAVDAVIDDCASRGVRAAIVISAGFAEVGAEGRKRQQELLGKIRDYGMRMVGPNCLGLLNTDPAHSLECVLRAGFSGAGKRRFLLSKRCSRLGGYKPSATTQFGPFKFYQRRQQSGYFR